MRTSDGVIGCCLGCGCFLYICSLVVLLWVIVELIYML